MGTFLVGDVGYYQTTCEEWIVLVGVVRNGESELMARKEKGKRYELGRVLIISKLRGTASMIWASRVRRTCL